MIKNSNFSSVGRSIALLGILCAALCPPLEAASLKELSGGIQIGIGQNGGITIDVPIGNVQLTKSLRLPVVLRYEKGVTGTRLKDLPDGWSIPWFSPMDTELDEDSRLVMFPDATREPFDDGAAALDNRERPHQYNWRSLSDLLEKPCALQFNNFQTVSLSVDKRQQLKWQFSPDKISIVSGQDTVGECMTYKDRAQIQLYNLHSSQVNSDCEKTTMFFDESAVTGFLAGANLINPWAILAHRIDTPSEAIEFHEEVRKTSAPTYDIDISIHPKSSNAPKRPNVDIPISLDSTTGQVLKIDDKIVSYLRRPSQFEGGQDCIFMSDADGAKIIVQEGWYYESPGIEVRFRPDHSEKIYHIITKAGTKVRKRVLNDKIVYTARFDKDGNVISDESPTFKRLRQPSGSYITIDKKTNAIISEYE